MKHLKILMRDAARNTKDKRISAAIKIIFFSHTFHLILIYRAGCLARRIPILGGALGLIIEYIIRVIYSSDISCKSTIGGGLIIMHGHDIVIGSDVVIGEDCKIFNGVTIGNKDTESNINGQPTIGRNVVIGTGAKILGALTIGDNVKIGANSVVLKDVASNSVAIGVPATTRSSKPP